jgi:hypothetical protein
LKIHQINIIFIFDINTSKKTPFFIYKNTFPSQKHGQKKNKGLDLKAAFLKKHKKG